jgi:hypothetical protein
MIIKEEAKRISQALAIYEVLFPIASFSDNIGFDYEYLNEEGFIKKWTPVYERVMKNKVFL